MNDVVRIGVASDHVPPIVDAEACRQRRAGEVDHREGAVLEQKPVRSAGVVAAADDVASVVDASCTARRRVGAVDGRVGLRRGGCRAQSQESQQGPEGQAARRLPLPFGMPCVDSTHANLLVVSRVRPGSAAGNPTFDQRFVRKRTARLRRCAKIAAKHRIPSAGAGAGQNHEAQVRRLRLRLGDPRGDPGRRASGDFAEGLRAAGSAHRVPAQGRRQGGHPLAPLAGHARLGPEPRQSRGRAARRSSARTRAVPGASAPSRGSAMPSARRPWSKPVGRGEAGAASRRPTASSGGAARSRSTPATT